jgi:hypothetical protein
MSSGFNGFGRRGRQSLAAALAGLLVATAALPATGQTILQRLFPRITGSGPTGSTPPPAPDAGQSSSGPLVVDPNVFMTPGYCPEIRIPLDGELYAFFETNHPGDPKFIRYLASISKTARECLAVTETGIVLKLGIAGRVMAGPKGGAGKVTLPFRVTVIKQQGNVVMHDKPYTTTVTVGGTGLAADFAHVIESLSFKRTVLDEDIIIYVGFDHGRMPGTS